MVKIKTVNKEDNPVIHYYLSLKKPGLLGYWVKRNMKFQWDDSLNLNKYKNKPEYFYKYHRLLTI